MADTETSTRNRVPPHLRPFVVEQRYDLYTAVDHAVWRYVMRQNLRALAGRAHPGYHRHFFETGMTVDDIPDVRKMNAALAGRGLEVVTVDGFIPPSVFMDFQAHGFLPIAQDIRTLEHIGYTPAPDIIHEAAGHAPLLLDETFGQFVRFIGEIGAKAISYREDYAVYEAIRDLSIVKEDPHAGPDRIHAAEQRLELAIAANTEVSEATEISRLYWWTVEYGLIGSTSNPRIYGAGLLSSMTEGDDCLKPHVAHLPFSLASIDYAYDITNPQPQLWVIDSFDQLFEATRTFAAGMAFNVGGTSSLEKARKSGRVATMVYDSGLQVSGTLDQLELDATGEAICAWFSGPTGLACQDRELEGHGVLAYPDGFVTPIGRVKGWPEGLEHATDAALAAKGTTWGTDVQIAFESGIVVEGRLESGVRADGRLVLLCFRDAVVRLGDRVLHRAAGYDMPVGASIVSVFAGSADKTRFVVERQPSRVVNLRAAATELEMDRERLYQAVRDVREGGLGGLELAARLRTVAHALELRHPTDWLLRLELLELLVPRDTLPREQERLLAQLDTLREDPAHRDLIDRGLALIAEQESRRTAMFEPPRALA